MSRAPLSYYGESSGAGVTALTPFDQAPDISQVVFGQQVPQPNFRAETVQLDWWRLVALAVGVWIGVKAFK